MPSKTFIVASSDLLEDGRRLDPSFHDEEMARLVRHLQALPYPLVKLGELDDVESVTIPGRFIRHYVDANVPGVPLLGTSTMLMARLPETARTWAKTKGLGGLMIEDGTILVSRSGTVGTSVLCGSSYEGFAASEHSARLRCGRQTAGYLAAYLKTQPGRALMYKQRHGKVVQHLTEHHIKQLLVPLLHDDDMQTISDLMHESAKLIDWARHELQQADILLHQALESTIGLPPTGPPISTWIGSLTQLMRDLRLDPHYYAPDIESLRQRIMGSKHKPLHEIARVWGVGRFRRYRTDRYAGIPLFSSSDIIRASVSPSAFISASRNQADISACLIPEHCILIPCSGTYGGILGRAIYAPAEVVGGAVTQHALRVLANEHDVDPYYLAAFLSSPEFGYPLISSLRHGKDVPEIHPAHVDSVPIPIVGETEAAGIASRFELAVAHLDKAMKVESEALAMLQSRLELDRDTPDGASEDGLPLRTS